MRKAIIVTKDYQYHHIMKYNGYPFLALAGVENQNVITAKIFLDFYRKQSLNVVDPSQTNNEENNVDELLLAIEYLYHKGYDEIVVLCNIRTSVINIFHYILLMKRFPHLKIRYEDKDESIEYYEEGTYVVNKENASSVSICPFVEAEVSIEYSLDNVNHKVINASSGPIYNLRYLQNIIVLKIEKGSVILLRKFDYEGGN